MITVTSLSRPPAAAAASASVAAEARVCTRATGETAVYACRRALELGLPVARQPAIEIALAVRLADLARWDEVVEVYRGAVSRRPSDAAARVRLGAALLDMQGRPADAELELREATRLRPDDPESHLRLGDALARLGRAPEAVAEFEEALRLDPTALDRRPAARAAFDAARRGEPWPK